MYDVENIFEDADLYPSFEKWKKDHTKEQILGYPNCGVLKRAQLWERNKILNVSQDFSMFHVFISKIEPKIVKVALEHSDWVVAM